DPGADMKQLFAEMFIWWHGQTMGTRLFTALNGKFVGEDDAGTKYYVSKKDPKRRWVTYNGPVEASAIQAGWHGWMHGRTDVPPTEQDYQPKNWEKPHQQNLSGTAAAYRPKGSLLAEGQRPNVTGDYDAWSPE
ncbi:NADH:ubiquinone oxidoreductase subunit NDUFA12, partial [Maritalea sp.]|uniref:NADH:ubiquinone oxidoreductase subunit NDUFA12 n=1 Tax=Maritalea sp. TaxID=2003361 RepID=UPI0039E6ED21